MKSWEKPYPKVVMTCPVAIQNCVMGYAQSYSSTDVLTNNNENRLKKNKQKNKSKAKKNKGNPGRN